MRPTASPIHYLPVFSHVGEAQRHVPLAERDPVTAVLGLGGTRQSAYQKLPGFGDILHQLGIQEIVDIGPECDVPREVDSIPVRRMGVLDAAEIDREFTRTTFGYLARPPTCLAKSEVFAGYCAHGVVPVIAQDFPGEIDRLSDGVHVLSPRTAKVIGPAELEQCSIAAWRWYSGHRLHDHAAVYARWMDAMGSRPQSAGRNYE